MSVYVPVPPSITAPRRPTRSYLRTQSQVGLAVRGRLDVMAGDGQIADQYGHQRRHHHRDPAGAETEPAQRLRPAEVVGERCTQGTSHHVGEPEGDDRVELEPPPE